LAKCPLRIGSGAVPFDAFVEAFAFILHVPYTMMSAYWLKGAKDGAG
jgi:hypothetical protein